ncbi:MAG: hypothetical protein ABSB94_12980 [Syntrophorhabdales bacterium]|jgi:hypothetical protein
MAIINLKIFKTLVGNDRDGDILSCDAIRYKDKLWLVPHWRENKIEGWKSPARLIRMDTLRFQNLPPGFHEDFVLNDPLPKVLLDHRVQPPKDTVYEIVENPEIHISTRSKGQDS